MAKIFLSYAREDASVAERFALAFRSCGWTVFWDIEIRTGMSFAEIIERELRGCDCVVVLWSAASVQSRWVKNEAQVGLDRDVLVPVSLATAAIPLAFLHQQVVQLQDWNGDVRDLRFEKLLNDIRHIIPPQLDDQKNIGDDQPLSRYSPYRIETRRDDRHPPSSERLNRRNVVAWSAGIFILTALIVSMAVLQFAPARSAKVPFDTSPSQSSGSVHFPRAQGRIAPVGATNGSLPTAPTQPQPTQASSGVPTTLTLVWADSSDATSYDVAFGTTSPPPIVSSQSGTSYRLSSLTAGARYVWQVTAKNAVGTATGPIWTFTTVSSPSVPKGPTPASGSILAPATTVILAWVASANATEYDVAFGTANPPPPVSMDQAATSYRQDGIIANTKYYWQVVAKNSGGSAPGPVWMFATANRSVLNGSGDDFSKACNLEPGASAQSSSEIKITWNADRNTDVAGYRVSIGTQAGRFTKTFDVGHVTTVICQGAARRQKYYFVVRSYNTSGMVGTPHEGSVTALD